MDYLYVDGLRLRRWITWTSKDYVYVDGLRGRRYITWTSMDYVYVDGLRVRRWVGVTRGGERAWHKRIVAVHLQGLYVHYSCKTDVIGCTTIPYGLPNL